MNSLSFSANLNVVKKLLLSIVFASALVMTFAAVALPDDLPAKRQPYPEFNLSGYDLSYCTPLSRSASKLDPKIKTKIYWYNDLNEPVVILWVWSSGSARFVKRVLPGKGYYTAFFASQGMALIAESRQKCIFTGEVEADDDGKRFDMSDVVVYTTKKNAGF